MTKIISKSAWGGKAHRASSSDPRTKIARSSRKYFVIHHTVTPRGNSVAEVKSLLRSIQAGHFGRGFSDIAYNYLVDRYGNIYKGRGLDYRAAAVGSNNPSTVNVAYIGNDNPTEAARAAIVELRKYVHSKLGRSLPVRGHRDFNSTACPGAKLYDWMKAGMKLKPTDPPAPDPKPEPTPDPIPEPTPDPAPKPQFEKWIIPGRMRALTDVALVNFETGAILKTFKRGDEFDIAGEVILPDETRYLMTPYSFGQAGETGKPTHPHGLPAALLETVEQGLPEIPAPPVDPDGRGALWVLAGTIALGAVVWLVDFLVSLVS